MILFAFARFGGETGDSGFNVLSLFVSLSIVLVLVLDSQPNKKFDKAIPPIPRVHFFKNCLLLLMDDCRINNSSKSLL